MNSGPALVRLYGTLARPDAPADPQGGGPMKLTVNTAAAIWGEVSAREPP